MPAVLLVTTTRMPGGAENQAKWLLESLSEMGVDSEWVGLFTPEGRPSKARAASQAARTTLDLRLRRASRVVTFNFHPNALGPVLCASPSSLLVTSIRSEALRHGRRAILLGPAFRRSDVITFNARSVMDSFVAEGLVDAEKAIFVPNRIRPVSRVKSSGRADTDGAFRFLAVGRLHRAKAFDVLLLALRKAQRGVDRELRLDIIGEGSEEERLRSLVQLHGQAGTVRFLGWRSDPWEHAGRYDAFVHAARWEGQPNALLEAMSVGLPVVATEVGGVPDLALAAEGCGIAVGAEDPERLSAAMVALANAEPSELKEMARAATEYVTRHHSSENVLREWLRALRLA